MAQKAIPGEKGLIAFIAPAVLRYPKFAISDYYARLRLHKIKKALRN